MKDLKKIVAEAEKTRAAGKQAALATVVGVKGSGYRLPGARMLIVDGRWVAGSISGGCLEDDVILRAGEAIRNNKAVVATYDTTGDDDIVFGVGLGCKGIIDILIEPIRAERGDADLVSFVKRCMERQQTAMAATVIRTQGQVDAEAGGRVLSCAGAAIADVRDDELKAVMLECLAAEQPGSLAAVTLSQGTAEIFIEHIEPPTPLVIFGAGHDAMPIVDFAKALGWNVCIVDHRLGYATAGRFPAADRIVIATPEQVLARTTLCPDTLAIVMTHNYLRDLKLLELLLASPVRYIGLLGPRKRTAQMLAELKLAAGIDAGTGHLQRLYAPVGLDIGSESPAEVALSVLAEMQAVITGHAGGHLRTRESPIHSRHQRPNAVAAVRTLSA